MLRILTPILALAVCAAQSPRDAALEVFRGGNYAAAIALLETVSAADSKDDAAAAALLSALIAENRYDKALELGAKLKTQFPDSAEALSARGDLAYYLGRMAEASQLYKDSIKKKETARALLGLYRVLRAASYHRTARLMLLRADELDRSDDAVLRAWMGILPWAKRKPIIEQYIKDHPDADRDVIEGMQTLLAINGKLDGEKSNLLQGEPVDAVLPMDAALANIKRLTGWTLKFRMNGGKPLRLLVDTGASGIILNRIGADKNELERLGRFQTRGIGDEGGRLSHAGIAETCEFGPLHYKNCVVHIVEENDVVGRDGLVGLDFFSDFLVELDFEKGKIRLSPHPQRPPNEQGYDRTITAGFTPVFQLGHHLLIPTRVNESEEGLFVMDTGAAISNIDSTFAKSVSKVRSDDQLRVRGLSGKVNKVSTADRAVLDFARFRQTNVDLPAFDLNSRKNVAIRMAGIIGMRVLGLFRLTIDYRNGLVKFDYRGETGVPRAEMHL
jgi:tetratricopeptide (TPR) repeat protein